MYRIVIPSYKRFEMCNNLTLKTLHENGIDSSLIFVFVVDEEYKEYKEFLNPEFYNEIIIGKKGLIEQQKFIENFFQEGEHIVSIDDDINYIDLSLSIYSNLNDFILNAFMDCKSNNSYIWGIYPVFNPFFREKQKPMSTCLNFIIGCLFGFINRQKKIEICFAVNKNDVERSIKYFLEDGIVIRYNKIGIKTKFFSKGGLGILEDRKETIKEETKILHENYKNISRIKVRKDGRYELVLKKCNKKTI
jgi:hypothetical protein